MCVCETHLYLTPDVTFTARLRNNLLWLVPPQDIHHAFDSCTLRPPTYYNSSTCFNSSALATYLLLTSYSQVTQGDPLNEAQRIED